MVRDEIKIGGHAIGARHAPFAIAEMSGNHNGSLERALRLVDAAADAGAHALKIQTYTADTMTLDLPRGEFLVADDGTNPWGGRTLYSLYQEAHTPWEWHPAIFERCRTRGLVGFSAPFDPTAVDFLETLDVPCYKIASFENVDLPLIRRVAATGKPMIISTGLANLREIAEAVEAARAGGCEELILLKCTSAYPADPRHSNLATIPYLRSMFHCEVGISDHTPGIGAAVAAAAIGAVVIEKHLTLSRADGGVDSTFSLEPHEFAQLVTESARAVESIGAVEFGRSEAETASLQFRRSLYVVRDVAQGEAFSAENVRAIRPGRGLPPKFVDIVLGRRAARAVEKGTPVTWELLGSPVGAGQGGPA